MRTKYFIRYQYEWVHMQHKNHPDLYRKDEDSIILELDEETASDIKSVKKAVYTLNQTLPKVHEEYVFTGVKQILAMNKL